MKLQIAEWKEKDGNNLTEDKLIRKNTEKPEYGSLMLVSNTATLTNGFVNKRSKVGFIAGTVVDLESIIDEYNLKAGADYSTHVAPHRIVTLEKLQSELTDEDMGYSEKINPSTGEILKKGGETIYMKTQVVAEGSDIKDTFVSHDTEPAIDGAAVEFTTAGKKIGTI